MSGVLEYFPLLLAGLAVTIQLAVGSLIGALILGTIVALARVSSFGAARFLGTAYVEALRNTPLLAHLFFWVFGLPFIGILLPEFVGAMLGLGFYTSAFVAESIRAGILAVGRGQIEASQALGLTRAFILRFVILPQALATSIPPLGNIAIALVKNTSVATAVLVPELMSRAELVNSRTFATYETFAVVGVMYLSLTLPMGWIVSRLEMRLTQFRRA